MTEKSGKSKSVAKTGKGGGRPKGSKNKGGPLLSRLITKGNKSVLGYLERMGNRAARWAANDEDKRAALTEVSKAIANAYNTIDQEVIVPLRVLDSEGWDPPKVAAAAIDYAPGRQVWIKSKFRPTYIDLEFSDKQLDDLFVVKTVRGKILVSVGEGGKMRFPVPKLHVSVKNPSEEVEA